jgi:hypothetical protein
LVAACVLNHWRLADIVARYQLDQPECLRRLLRLDRMRLIDLLPGNRIRINVARDFDLAAWGPIRALFRRRAAEDDFLSGAFERSPRGSSSSCTACSPPRPAPSSGPSWSKLRRHFASLHDESQSGRHRRAARHRHAARPARVGARRLRPPAPTEKP